MPLLIGIPGRSEGSRVPWTVSQLDIHPTLLDLAQVEVQRPAGGAPLCDRSGKITVDQHRPALTTLDHLRSDPASWEAGIAFGSLRVRPTEDIFTVLVFDSSGKRPTQRVSLTQIDNFSDREVRRAVEFFFRERQRFNRLAQDIPAPGWGTGTSSDEEALRALGYL